MCRPAHNRLCYRTLACRWRDSNRRFRDRDRDRCRSREAPPPCSLDPKHPSSSNRLVSIPRYCRLDRCSRVCKVGSVHSSHSFRGTTTLRRGCDTGQPLGQHMPDPIRGCNRWDRFRRPPRSMRELRIPACRVHNSSHLHSGSAPHRGDNKGRWLRSRRLSPTRRCSSTGPSRRQCYSIRDRHTRANRGRNSNRRCWDNADNLGIDSQRESHRRRSTPRYSNRVRDGRRLCSIADRCNPANHCS